MYIDNNKVVLKATFILFAFIAIRTDKNLELNYMFGLCLFSQIARAKNTANTSTVSIYVGFIFHVSIPLRDAYKTGSPVKHDKDLQTPTLVLQRKICCTIV